MTLRSYLYEAGGGKSGRVEAESVADARARLAGDGYPDAVVHDDDFLSDLRAASEKQSAIAQPADLDALLRRDPGALAMTLYGLRKNWLAVSLVMGALGAMAVLGASAWLWAIALAIVGYVAYALLFPGWLQWQQNEMHRRFWAGEWDACEKIASGLRGLKMVQRLPSACLEFDSRIAACRLMKGNAPGAYAMLARWENHPGLAQGSWTVKNNLLHFLARDWKRSLEGAQRFYEECAGSDTASIDLALLLARLGDDDARATQVLDAIDPQRIVPMQAAYLAWARGVLSLKRGDDEAALRSLAASAAGMQELAVNPVSWGSVALSIGYLSVAMARTGQAEAARGMLAPVLSIVERHGEERLLGWLRAGKVLA